ncbi:MAG: hypothetical protein OXC92_02240 [Flavobacteriaceae bacterium]|nr:hypothetical protein [Flavobacteriaceae bacterium]MCY4297693.1 hypothetical protein [Flavobacteriaceae bacterium]
MNIEEKKRLDELKTLQLEIELLSLKQLKILSKYVAKIEDEINENEKESV